MTAGPSRTDLTTEQPNRQTLSAGPGQYDGASVNECSIWSIRTWDREINDSNDFVYNLDSIPYLYRYSEHRSHRLYDLADSNTKSTLFASANGKLKNSTKGIYYAVVSDDNTAGAPVADPFDTIGGWVSYGPRERVGFCADTGSEAVDSFE